MRVLGLGSLVRQVSDRQLVRHSVSLMGSTWKELQNIVLALRMKDHVLHNAQHYDNSIAFAVPFRQNRGRESQHVLPCTLWRREKAPS